MNIRDGQGVEQARDKMYAVAIWDNLLNYGIVIGNARSSTIGAAVKTSIKTVSKTYLKSMDRNLMPLNSLNACFVTGYYAWGGASDMYQGTNRRSLDQAHHPTPAKTGPRV